MRDINILNRRRCIIAFVVCLLIVVLSILGIIKRILAPLGDTTIITGKDVFKYFTVLSNAFVNACAILCVPFEIEGLLKENYHLPRWIVDFLFVGVTNTTITLLISLFMIAPTKGFVFTFSGSLLYMHLLCPLLALILFVYINVDHNIKVSRIFYAVIPVVIYGVIYLIKVFVLGQENGGWIDLYYVKGKVPGWLLLIGIFVIGILIAYILRKHHNKKHQEYKKIKEEYYMENYKNRNVDIIDAIKDIALKDKRKYKEGNIFIPVHTINTLKRIYKSDYENKKLYDVYVETFFS